MADESKPVRLSKEEFREMVTQKDSGGGKWTFGSLPQPWILVLLLLQGGDMVYDPHGGQLNDIAVEVRATADAIREIQGGLDRTTLDVAALERDLRRAEDALRTAEKRLATNTVELRLVKRLLDAHGMQVPGNEPGE